MEQPGITVTKDEALQHMVRVGKTYESAKFMEAALRVAIQAESDIAELQHEVEKLRDELLTTEQGLVNLSAHATHEVERIEKETHEKLVAAETAEKRKQETSAALQGVLGEIGEARKTLEDLIQQVDDATTALHAAKHELSEIESRQKAAISKHQMEMTNLSDERARAKAQAKKQIEALRLLEEEDDD
jgi:chromosome segregation ATPase